MFADYSEWITWETSHDRVQGTCPKWMDYGCAWDSPDHASDTMQYNTQEQTTTVTTANYHSCCVQVPSPYYIGYIYLHGWILLTENIGKYELNPYGSTEKFDDDGLWLHWMLLMLTNLQQLGAFACCILAEFNISNISTIYVSYALIFTYLHMFVYISCPLS